MDLLSGTLAESDDSVLAVLPTSSLPISEAGEGGCKYIWPCRSIFLLTSNGRATAGTGDVALGN